MMFSRNKTPTISLPLYNSPHRSPRTSSSPQRRNRLTRFMALGLLSFLLCVTLFTFGKAAPLIYKSPSFHSSVTLQNAVRFQDNMEAIRNIYMGNATPSHENIDHLVIVTGHTILLDESNYKNDDAWVLESFQKGGQVATFIEHILKGIEIVQNDPNSLLVFSGGQTRPTAGPRSEGQSYWKLAQQIYGDDKTLNKVLLERVVSEEFARDSYENLLFSLCRFYEVTGRYPAEVTVIGFGFKERRFTELHRKAVRFPKERFSYIGIDPDNANLEELNRLEMTNAALHFESDPYACSSKTLSSKRLGRNPYRRMHGYGSTNSELLDLLSWCPESGSRHRWFNEALPWVHGEL